MAMTLPLASMPTTWLLLFSAISSTVFIAILPCYHLRLCRSSTKVRSSWHGKLKLVLCVFYAALQLVQLIRSPGGGTVYRGVVASSLNFAAALGLIWASNLAHKRSIRPSSLITVYLLAQLACQALWTPLTSRREVGFHAYALSSSTLILSLAELRSKRPILLKAYANATPEAITSFIGKAIFLWINPILIEGHSNELSGDHIPSLDQSLSSKTLRQTILRAWDQRDKPESGTTLLLVLLSCLLVPFLSAIIPRLFLILFRFSQPLLISHAIRFVTNSSADDDGQSGIWVIVAATTIYTGIALSTSLYQHRLNRLQVMIRGTLIGLLHDRALNARGSDEADGRVVTLLSNDISNVEKSGEMFHGTWGQFMEVVVGTLLLAREVGWLWPVPIVFIFFCSRVSRHVATHLKAEQGNWNAATQQRLSVTSSMLGYMKSIKMLGFQQAVVNYVEGLRCQEMDAARGVRWLMVAYNASANALGMFAPVLTIVLYAVLLRLREDSLDVETAFTTIAILAMITHPANMVMTFVPRAVVSFASFERIQSYLVCEHPAATSVLASNSLSIGVTDTIAATFTHATIAALGVSKPILQDVTFEIPKGSITVLTGPVGSGKTSLARALLGEMRIISGSITTTVPSIAYCAQIAWLPNQTIRTIILGPDSQHDEAWYETIIHACALTADLNTLPNGDKTSVGSNGMNLSGGQRQRVALARAIYARPELLVLDDSFSALDGPTQREVMTSLLRRPEGLLRKLGAAVFWISTVTKHFHLADDVIVLADGWVKERGAWDQLWEDDPLLAELIDVHDSGASSVAATSKSKESTPTLSRRVALAAPEPDGASSRKNSDLSLYSYYFRAARPRNIILLFTANAVCAFFKEVPPYWLMLWTERPTASLPFYASIYLLILATAWLGTNGIMSTTLLLIAPTSGIALHSRILATITAAPLAFFSTTPTAALLNRLSADLQLVDNALAPALAALATQVFKLLTQTTLLLLAQPRVALALPPSAAVVYIVQRVYLRTSRPLRTAELASRAAILNTFTETVAGAPTLRAFGWQASVAAQASNALDESQRPLYLLLCLQCWLGVVLDLLVAGMAVGTIALAVWFRGSMTGAAVGMALNVILVVNTTLLSFVRSWTGLEVSLGAVVRLRQVEKTTPAEEEALVVESRDVFDDVWSGRGEVIFSNVSASYNLSAPPALRTLSLTIESGQTVVVCGRTGSGKSSLLLSLLCLIDTTAGTITVDGVDIATLPRATVREKLFITVAQEAFVLPQGSLCFNLDPEGMAGPGAIVEALVKTGLWDHFRGKGLSTEDEVLEFCPLSKVGSDDEAVLNMPLSSLPTLSAGQSQLLALGRALVRRHVLCSRSGSTYSDVQSVKPIILLDEVTATLDPVTEGNIYDVIQDEFVEKGHTIVMVTHKLAGVKDRLRKGRDRVVWMSEGSVERIEVVL